MIAKLGPRFTSAICNARDPRRLAHRRPLAAHGACSPGFFDIGVGIISDHIPYSSFLDRYFYVPQAPILIMKASVP